MGGTVSLKREEGNYRGALPTLFVSFLTVRLLATFKLLAASEVVFGIAAGVRARHGFLLSARSNNETREVGVTTDDLDKNLLYGSHGDRDLEEDVVQPIFLYQFLFVYTEMEREMYVHSWKETSICGAR